VVAGGRFSAGTLFRVMHTCSLQTHHSWLTHELTRGADLQATDGALRRESAGVVPGFQTMPSFNAAGLAWARDSLIRTFEPVLDLLSRLGNDTS